MILDRFKMTDKVAIVTGAGRGIGAATAVGLAQAGADVVISARTPNSWTRWSPRWRRPAPGRGHSRRPERPRRRGRPGGHAGRVRPAGHRGQQRRRDDAPGLLDTSPGRLERHSTSTWPRPTPSSVRPYPSCSEGRRARSSTSPRSWVGWRAAATWPTARPGGLAHYTRLAAQDLSPRIRVNAIAVGSVPPPPSTSSCSPTSSARPSSRDAAPPLGDPEDIAAAIVYLASEAGSYVTGKVLEVDGGIADPNLDWLPDLWCHTTTPDGEHPERGGPHDRKTYRVVQWSTGHVGKHAIAGIDARPDLELVGVWVSNPDKVGKDAGELAGLGRTSGSPRPTTRALLALKPDCIVHTALADNRLFEAMATWRFLRAGINVVSSEPGVPAVSVRRGRRRDGRRVRAAAEGGASIFVNGVDPGFGNDALPLVMTGIPSASRRCAASSCSTTRPTTRARSSKTSWASAARWRRAVSCSTRRPDDGLGQRRPPARRRARRRARRDRGVVRALPGAGGVRDPDRHDPEGHPGRAALRGARHRTAKRSSSSST